MHCGIRGADRSRCASPPSPGRGADRRDHRRRSRHRPGTPSERVGEPADAGGGVGRRLPPSGRASGRGTRLLWQCPRRPEDRLSPRSRRASLPDPRRASPYLSPCDAFVANTATWGGWRGRVSREDAGDVVLDRLLREVHPLGDDAVGEALADEVDDLRSRSVSLPNGSSGVRCCVRGAAPSAPRCCVGPKQVAAGGDGAGPPKPGSGRGSA